MADAVRDGNYVPSALGVSTENPAVTIPLKVNPNTGALLVQITA